MFSIDHSPLLEQPEVFSDDPAESYLRLKLEKAASEMESVVRRLSVPGRGRLTHGKHLRMIVVPSAIWAGRIRSIDMSITALVFPNCPYDFADSVMQSRIASRSWNDFASQPLLDSAEQCLRQVIRVVQDGGHVLVWLPDNMPTFLMALHQRGLSEAQILKGLFSPPKYLQCLRSELLYVWAESRFEERERVIWQEDYQKQSWNLWVTWLMDAIFAFYLMRIIARKKGSLPDWARNYGLFLRQSFGLIMGLGERKSFIPVKVYRQNLGNSAPAFVGEFLLTEGEAMPLIGRGWRLSGPAIRRPSPWSEFLEFLWSTQSSSQQALIESGWDFSMENSNEVRQRLDSMASIREDVHGLTAEGILSTVRAGVWPGLMGTGWEVVGQGRFATLNRIWSSDQAASLVYKEGEGLMARALLAYMGAMQPVSSPFWSVRLVRSDGVEQTNEFDLPVTGPVPVEHDQLTLVSGGRLPPQGRSWASVWDLWSSLSFSPSSVGTEDIAALGRMGTAGIFTVSNSRVELSTLGKNIRSELMALGPSVLTNEYARLLRRSMSEIGNLNPIEQAARFDRVIKDFAERLAAG